MKYLFRAYSKEQIESAKTKVSDWLDNWFDTIQLSSVEFSWIDTVQSTFEEGDLVIESVHVKAFADIKTWETFYKNLIGVNEVSFGDEIGADRVFMLERVISLLNDEIKISNSPKGLASFDQAHEYASGWLKATITVLGRQIYLLFSPVCFELAETRGLNERFSNPVDLVEDEKVSIKVMLGEATVSLGELRNLSPGDIVTLDHLVDQPAYVTTESGKRLFAGQLGTKDGTRALALVK